MRTMTIEEMLMKESDVTLLNIHDELESCLIPATSYAHEYVRKINRMIDEGKLCVVAGKYRNVYLPTISKMIYKEMARRYSAHCYYTKTTPFDSVQDGDADDEIRKCAWCNCEYEASDLRGTDLGCLCDQCISAIRSRGEDLIIFD